MKTILHSIQTEDQAFELQLQRDRLVLEWVGRPPVHLEQGKGMHTTVGVTGVGVPYFGCRRVVFLDGEVHLLDPAGVPLSFGRGPDGLRFQQALREFPAAEARRFAEVASQQLETFWCRPGWWRWWTRQRWQFPSTRTARRLVWLYDHSGLRWVHLTLDRMFRRPPG
ncbi:hypothetical protein [Deinococcus planocerae]|uniref:hypothetical protein n=1 Tax=Deinococcus planocerae TaxID=1737569 RepID=UPI000C7F36E0|nr:hypothetical protein [Deinococcus planocerae]